MANRNFEFAINNLFKSPFKYDSAAAAEGEKKIKQFLKIGGKHPWEFVTCCAEIPSGHLLAGTRSGIFVVEHKPAARIKADLRRVAALTDVTQLAYTDSLGCLTVRCAEGLLTIPDAVNKFSLGTEEITAASLPRIHDGNLPGAFVLGGIKEKDTSTWRPKLLFAQQELSMMMNNTSYIVFEPQPDSDSKWSTAYEFTEPCKSHPVAVFNKTALVSGSTKISPVDTIQLDQNTACSFLDFSRIKSKIKHHSSPSKQRCAGIFRDPRMGDDRSMNDRKFIVCLEDHFMVVDARGNVPNSEKDIRAIDPGAKEAVCYRDYMCVRYEDELVVYDLDGEKVFSFRGKSMKLLDGHHVLERGNDKTLKLAYWEEGLAEGQMIAELVMR